MSRVRLIRCKTPYDIIVVRAKGSRANDVVEALMYLPAEKNCGHTHEIVIGDVYFSRGKRGNK